MSDSLLDMHAGEAFGRYELLLPIARGGMSRVWAARLRGTRGFQKLVAIKTLLPSPDEPDLLERMLLDEARLASQIQHPNVAQYLDLGERNGVLFVVMEWVEGEALRSLMRLAAVAGGVPLELSAQIIAQACKGLHGAHELRDTAGSPLGLVHCDVSPPNLMIGTNGAVKLIDFGIAKATLGSNPDRLVAGKLAFMAPEQARGEVLDRRADLFSLGIVLYLLTTGRHPFPGHKTSESLNQMYSSAEVVPPSVVRAGYPKALERVVLKALSLERSARFSSAAEMLTELTDAMPGRASESQLADFVQQVAGTVLDARRTAIVEALRASDVRHSEGPFRAGTPVSLPPSAAPVREDEVQTAATDAPMVTENEPSKPTPQRARRLRALGLGATFFLGAVAAAVLSQTGILQGPRTPQQHLGASGPVQTLEQATRSAASLQPRTERASGGAGLPLARSNAPEPISPSDAGSTPGQGPDKLQDPAEQCSDGDRTCVRTNKRPPRRAICPAGMACPSNVSRQPKISFGRRYGI